VDVVTDLKLLFANFGCIPKACVICHEFLGDYYLIGMKNRRSRRC